MTIPFYCLLVALVLPYLAKLPVMVAMQREGGYDNNHPRDQQARLKGWGRRALAAHQNSFEILPIFACGVFLAHLTGADPTWSARLAVLFIVSRVLYNALYLADLSSARSLVWFTGLLCSLALASLGMFK